MSNTINNSIPFVPENTVDPAAGLNLSLNVIDALMQLMVQTVGLDVPPAGVEGQRHIVGTSPTGAWSGQANKLARYLDGAWHFYDARYAINAADGFWYIRPSTSWVAAPGSEAVQWGEIAGDILDQTDLQSALDGKVDKVAGKQLSTEDFTTAEKNKLADMVKVASTTDTTQGRLITTGYLDIGKLDKDYWPKATSLLSLMDGPDRKVWVEAGTLDAPHPLFFGSVEIRRRDSVNAILLAEASFENAKYRYVSTGFGVSGWVKETLHEVGEWVDLRSYLLSPWFWDTARDGNNHFPQIRLVDRNTVELRGIASYNASSAAPPNGVAFRVPEGFRPQMTSAGVCFSDAGSPIWFGTALYMVQGVVNYNSLPGWANGNVQMLPHTAPNPVADGAVDLSGIRYYLS